MSQLLVKEILRRQSEQIKIQIAKYFKNKEDREDVFQEMVIHLLDRIKHFDPEHTNANLAGWVSRVVKHKCISILRKRNSKPKFQDFEDAGLIDNYRDNNLIEEEFDPSLRSIKTFNIEKLLLKLNERDRKLIILRIFKSISIKEIDKIMGLNNSSVYIQRAIDKLREFEDAKTFFDVYDEFIPE